MTVEDNAGIRHIAGSAVSVTLASIILAAKIEPSPWENKSEWPSIYPGHSHKLSEGYV